VFSEVTINSQTETRSLKRCDPPPPSPSRSSAAGPSPPPLPPRTYLKRKCQPTDEERVTVVETYENVTGDVVSVEAVETVERISATPKRARNQWGGGVVTRRQRAEAENDPARRQEPVTPPRRDEPTTPAADPVVSPPENIVSERSNDVPNSQENEPLENNALNETELDYFIASKSDSQTYFNKQLTISSTILVQITGPRGVSMAQHIPAFRRHLEKILEDVGRAAKPHEHFQVLIGCKNATANYMSTPFYRADEPHAIARVMSLINQSVHSNAKWMLDDEIEVIIKHVKNHPKVTVSGGSRYVATCPEATSIERRCIVSIKNKDNMCLQRAVAVILHSKAIEKAEAEGKPPSKIKELEDVYDAVRRQDNAFQTQEAFRICTKASISSKKPCGDREIRRIENAFNIYIKVLAADQFLKFTYDGITMNPREGLEPDDFNTFFLFRRFIPETKKYHVDAIRSHKGFFKKKLFCIFCNKTYPKRNHHICRDIKHWCYSCWDRKCDDKDYTFPMNKFCNICGIRFRSERCQRIHETEGVCKNDYFCPDCKEVVPRKSSETKNRLAPNVNPPEIVYETNAAIKLRHKCVKKCHLCKEPVEGVLHKCFIQKLEYKQPSDKLLFFDFETDQSSKIHKPIYCHMIWYDPKTDEWKEHHFSAKTCKNGDVRDETGKFLFSKQFQGYTMIAHNMKAFDGCFLLRYLGENCLKATPIFAGKKIMSLEVKSLKIRIIDSFNFLTFSLAQIEDSFGLENCTKGYFPHFFAKPSNYSYKGDLPPMETYGHNGMHPKARDKFIEWYLKLAATVTDRPKFDFERDIAIYCRQDVIILKEGCMRFKNLLMQLTNNRCDPFCYTTLASVATAIFKADFMKENTIAAVPPNGYADIQNFSSASLEWLEWMRQMNGVVNMKHIGNSPVGEATIGSFRVDGIDVTTQTAYDFHGCYYHGCPKCFPDRHQLNKLIGKTFQAVYESTTDKGAILALQDWNYVQMWECEWKAMKAEDPDIEKFVQENKHRLTPMNPFDSFFGGRVEVFKMGVNDGSLMNYEDVTSLYPFINATKRYPVGHPEIILNDFGDLETICDRFFGFIKCTILPPDRLYIPVLPGKYGRDKKLLFTLCRTCAEERIPEKRCVHSEGERALTGTWFIEEVKTAVEKGYKIQEVFGVYHFKETSTELFADYIRLFYKLKLTSSGIPSHCKTDQDLDDYIAQVQEKEKITLKKEDFENNPGMRQLSKLLINSLWGKFGLRRNLPSHQFCTTMEEISTLLHDESIEVTNILAMHENMALVTHRKKNADFFELNNHANIYIASATTSYARIEIFNHLDFVGERSAYADTDSAVYIVDLINKLNNLPRGSFLGELTNELKQPDDYICEFYSGGPKNYGYRTLKGEECLKVKGFSLNYINRQAFTFENMKQVILNSIDVDPNCDEAIDAYHQISRISDFKTRAEKNRGRRDAIMKEHHSKNPDQASSIATSNAISVYNPNTIARSSTWELLSKAEQKLYTVCYDKRIVMANLDTYPFGYRFPPSPSKPSPS
jgi:hypothetical protein